MLKNSLFAIAVLLCLCACDKKRVFDEYHAYDGQWDKDSIAKFEFETSDTVSKHNLFVNIRNNNNYPYSNLYLIVQMQQPGTNLTKADTLEYEMANPDGSLMGEGFSDVKENKLWYKENVIFPKPGKYIFTVQQAVRQAGQVPGVRKLDGIMEVGFRIESTE